MSPAGARRLLLAVAGGVALYAAHPPVGLGWLGLVAVAPLAALARDLGRDPAPLRRGMAYGFLAGLVCYLPLLQWIANIGEVIAWPLLAVTQALFIGFFVAGLAWWGEGRWRGLAVVVWWVALEALRTVGPLGGFPWGVLGYSQHDGGLVLELARTLGVLGVSAACAGIGACVEEVVQRASRVVRGGHGPAGVRADAAFSAARTPLLGILGLLLAAVLLGGDPPEPTGETVDVAAVQGLGVEGSTGREPGRTVRVAEAMLQVTRRLGDAERGPPELTVWPENALDGDVRTSTALRETVSEALGVLDGGPLLAGMIADGPRSQTFLNTVVLLEGDPVPADTYVKRKLVPFGEFVPLREWLDWFPPLDRVPSDGLPGESPGVIDAAGARVGSVICYEVIFPHLVHSQVREGAELLVVSTNNSSFGRSPASEQHIAFSQLRAVETGRYVVHAALSGVSAFVDPNGAVSQETEQYEQAVIRADLPLVREQTLAMVVGDAVGWTAVILAFVGLAWRGVWRRRGRMAPSRGGH